MSIVQRRKNWHDRLAYSIEVTYVLTTRRQGTWNSKKSRQRWSVVFSNTNMYTNLLTFFWKINEYVPDLPKRLRTFSMHAYCYIDILSAATFYSLIMRTVLSQKANFLFMKWMTWDCSTMRITMNMIYHLVWSIYLMNFLPSVRW